MVDRALPAGGFSLLPDARHLPTEARARMASLRFVKEGPWWRHQYRVAKPIDMLSYVGFKNLMIGATLFLALRSPIMVIAAPIMIIRFWSDASHHWASGFQYNAIPALITSVAFIDALRLVRRHRPGLPSLAVAAGLAVNLAMKLVQDAARVLKSVSSGVDVEIKV